MMRGALNRGPLKIPMDFCAYPRHPVLRGGLQLRHGRHGVVREVPGPQAARLRRSAPDARTKREGV